MTDELINRIEVELDSLDKQKDAITEKQKQFAIELLNAFKEKYNTDTIHFDTEFGDCPSAIYIGDFDGDVHDVIISSINIDKLTFTGDAPYEGLIYEDVHLMRGFYNFDWKWLADEIIGQIRLGAFEPSEVENDREELSEEDAQEIKDLFNKKLAREAKSKEE